MEKMTRMECFTAIKSLLESNPSIENYTELMDFVVSQISQLENKAVKAKERAAERKTEPDELYDKIAALLTDEYQTREDIMAQIDDEEITPQKVSARLTKMVKCGFAEKTTIKVDKRSVMAYHKI